MGDLVAQVVEEGTGFLDLRPAVGSPVTSFHFHYHKSTFDSDVIVDGVEAVVNVHSGVVTSHSRLPYEFRVCFFTRKGIDHWYHSSLLMQQKYKGWIAGHMDPHSRDGQAFLRRLAIELDFE
jgi:hypothetical protein